VLASGNFDGSRATMEASSSSANPLRHERSHEGAAACERLQTPIKPANNTAACDAQKLLI
jgi:hypothetical protein